MGTSPAKASVTLCIRFLKNLCRAVINVFKTSVYRYIVKGLEVRMNEILLSLNASGSEKTLASAQSVSIARQEEAVRRYRAHRVCSRARRRRTRYRPYCRDDPGGGRTPAGPWSTDRLESPVKMSEQDEGDRCKNTHRPRVAFRRVPVFEIGHLLGQVPVDTTPHSSSLDERRRLAKLISRCKIPLTIKLSE